MDEWIKKHKITLCSGIIFVAALFCLAGLHEYLPLKEDSAIHIVLARSLAGGLGNTYTAGPVNIPLNYYPLAYPAIIAPLVSHFPHNYLVLELLNILFTVLYLVILCYLITKIFTCGESFWIIPLVALNPHVSYYSHQILTEMPYSLFSVLALYFFVLYRKKKSMVNPYFFLSIAAIIISFYTRLIGISLMAAVVLFLFLKKEFKRSCIFACVFLLSSSSWVYQEVIAGKSLYIKEFSSVTHTILNLIWRWVYNLGATVGKELPDLFFYPFLSSIDPIAKIFLLKLNLGVVLGLLISVGFVLKLKKEGIGIEDVYTFIYLFVIYLPWTHHSARYLLPVLPFLAYYLITGIRRLAKGKRFSYVVIVLLLSITIAGNIVATTQLKEHAFLPTEQSFIQAADWIKANVRKESIIISKYPSWVYVYTDGCRGIKFMITTDTSRQYKHIMDNKVDYLIIDQNKIFRDDARDYLFPLVKRFGDTLTLVYCSQNEPKTYIYKVLR